jgi:2'-5' RNA ligase
MTGIGRAFVAVVPPDEVVAALAQRVAAVREMEPGLRWLAPERAHVTLQFLGRVPDVEAVVGAVGDAVVSVPSFTVQLGGAGAFPKPRRASVVWAGVLAGDAELAALAQTVQRATALVGFAGEDRRLHPHVTLARVRHPKPVEAVLAAHGDDPIGPRFEVTEIVLFESRTRREGAVHTEVARLPLGSSGPSEGA